MLNYMILTKTFPNMKNLKLKQKVKQLIAFSIISFKTCNNQCKNSLKQIKDNDYGICDQMYAVITI